MRAKCDRNVLCASEIFNCFFLLNQRKKKEREQKRKKKKGKKKRKNLISVGQD